MKLFIRAMKIVLYIVRGIGFKCNKFKRNRQKRHLPSIVLHANEQDRIFHASYQDAFKMADACTQHFHGRHIVTELYGPNGFIGYGVCICKINRLLTNDGVANLKVAY